MLSGEDRRIQLLDILKNAKEPVSGTELANRLGVSRQVIVQDIALLRAVDKNIISTNRGYIFFDSKSEEGKVKRVFKVQHRDEDVLGEFYAVLEYGAKVVDVFVEHEIYGKIIRELSITTREEARQFAEQLCTSKSKSLNVLTAGVHYHTVEADNEETLDKVEIELEKHGYLA